MTHLNYIVWQPSNRFNLQVYRVSINGFVKGMIVYAHTQHVQIDVVLTANKYYDVSDHNHFKKRR